MSKLPEFLILRMKHKIKIFLVKNPLLDLISEEIRINIVINLLAVNGTSEEDLKPIKILLKPIKICRCREELKN